MNKKVLIVEDDVVFCKILTKFLTKNSYEVLDAQNGKDAIELMEMNKFEFAILDYRLPDMNGIEILEKLKTQNKEAKTILITRYGDQDVASKAIDKGADAFISKPINPDELLAVIKGL
ncbi:response regulator [Belliella sp. DSM 111904]|uniref:Response regulator n=1 Tax=Belliella filtrata TaxID=2923435 RepID=A0ABS9V4A0_9BACT|nr:response regulator [Belliella filtrata]MCH7411226.1 response regulator [Belliella filtrata]